MKKILFIASHRPNRAPGQRFRFEMFFDELEKAGFGVELSFLLDEEADRILYSKGNYFKKGLIALQSLRKRKADLKRAKDFDLVVIFREALMTRSIFFEKALAQAQVPMIFDFDDAIWIKDVSANNRILSVLKDENKIKKILPLCSAVTAGNAYLADFAKPYNPQVHIIPSTIDEGIHKPIQVDKEDKRICVGWSGSLTTMAHFESLLPVLEKLRAKYGQEVRLLSIGAKSSKAEELNIEYLPWNAASENEDLNQIDIGLMPLPNNKWTAGKCGMKALLYMAAGKATIVTPLGVNAEIIQHGLNGLHATSQEDWYEAIVDLLENPSKRKQLGEAGRAKVVQHYSKKAWTIPLIDVYKKAINKH